ncbi:MAG: TonB-dependent receptor plug domain-containing protein [Bacteroidales bacterium]|nr:TonB-dependent receptor plug domain-containing protein [Bacteroidales bacterium]
MIKLKSAYCLCLILLSTIVYGQGMTDSTFILNQVEIKAKRNINERGLNITKIDSLVIKKSANSSLSELLSKHSPVFIKSYGQGSLATASFRGTAASHTQVEWNGININNPMLGQVDFSLIPVYFIDEVLLFHGGSSMQKSSGALGGSVIVNSEPEWTKGFNADLIQTVGSFGTYQSYLKLKTSNNKILLDLRLFSEQSKNDFQFYNNANGLFNYENQQNSNYVKNGALLNTYYRLGENNLISVNIWGQMANRNLPPIMSYEGTGRDEYQKDSELRISGKWKLYKNKFKSELNSGFSKTNLDYFLANNTPLGMFISYDSKSNTQSLFNKYSFEYKPWAKTIIAGMVNFNYHKVHIFENREQTGYDKTRSETGMKLSVHREFFERLTVYGLVYSEFVDNSFAPLMPSVGLEFDVLKNQNLYLKSNFTRNYHQPTLNDLYWLPGGNVDLRPERGYTGDVALDYSFRKDASLTINASIGGYMSRINDWIIWRPGEYRFWQAENIKEVFARGIEATLSGRVVVSEFDFEFFTNYTFTKTTNKEETLPGDNSVGKQLIYIPLNKANVMFSTGYKGFKFSYNLALIGERFTTSSNEITRHVLPAYSLHDIYLGKEMFVFGKALEVQFRINNLFDLDYQAILWRAMPGRNYKIFVKISI